jgi:uncharacterized protein
LIEAKDFSHVTRFPGETGNFFDIVLHKAMDLEKIPDVLFFLGLTGLSFVGFPVNGWVCLAVLIFFLFDWISIALLPKYRRSFGPVKPPVLVLAILRMLPIYFTHSAIWVPLEILGCFLQVYAFWIEPFQIKITWQEIVTNKLPAGVRFQLLHLGDLHLERTSIREEKVNQLIKEVNADVILFSGDYLCLSSIRDKHAWADLRQVLQQWKAPLGVYGVTGSPAVDLPENFPVLLEGTPVKLLKDEKVTLHKDGAAIRVIGLECTHKPHLDAPRLKVLLEGEKEGFRLLLHHSPDIAPHISNDTIDLQLAGHTHGGQVCLPFIGPLFTGSLYGLKFKSGRYQLKNMVLYITRGLGMEGLSAPRVRFLCPPEIVVWKIIGKDAKEISENG